MTSSPARPDFRAALDAHLGTITERDLDAFSATLTTDDGLYVIFPDGSALTSTESVVDFHRQWFADDQWRFEPEIVKTIVGKSTATALLRYDYRDAPDSAPRASWLVLIFEVEDGEWRLVHDQNTRITAGSDGG